MKRIIAAVALVGTLASGRFVAAAETQPANTKPTTVASTGSAPAVTATTPGEATHASGLSTLPQPRAPESAIAGESSRPVVPLSAVSAPAANNVPPVRPAVSNPRAATGRAGSPPVSGDRPRPAHPPQTGLVPPSALPAQPAPPFEGEVPEGYVVIEFQLYRVRGDISGQTSLTDNLYKGIEQKDAADQNGPFSFFVKADLNVAGVKLQADETRWTWDGKEWPPETKRVELLAAPKVMLLTGHSFEISVGSSQPIEYFERRDDGLFELIRLDGQTGLTLSGEVVEGKSDRVELHDLTLWLRAIEKRESIEGVALDVGRPLVKTREYKTTVAVKPGRYYGMQLTTEGYGFLILRLAVQRVQAGKIPGEPSSGSRPPGVPGAAVPGPRRR